MPYDPQWQTASVPFAVGLQTKQADAAIPVEALSKLENGAFTKTGSVRKRAGYEELLGNTATSVVAGDPRGLMSWADTLIQVTDYRVYSQDDHELWADRGPYLGLTASAREVAHANKNQTAADVAVANDIAVVVWKYATDSLYFQCFDANTYAPLSAVTALATANADHPSAVAVNGTVLLCYTDTSADAVKARLIQTSSLQASVATANTVTLAGDLTTTTRRWAICAGATGEAWLAWQTDGSAALAAGIGLARINSAGEQVTAVLVDDDVPTCRPGICYDPASTKVLVAWTKASFHGYREFTTQPLAAVDATQEVAASAVDRVACGPGVAAYETLGSPVSDSSVKFYNVATTTATTVQHCHLASHGWRPFNKTTFVVGHQSRTSVQSAYYIYTYDGECSGVLESGLANNRLSTDELAHYSDGFMALGFRRRLSLDNFVAQYAHTGIRLHKFRDDKFSSAEFGKSTYFSGCQLWQFDGAATFEAGFHMYPDVLGTDLASTDANGQNILTAKQHNYRFYYEWYTAEGELIRSAYMQRSITTNFASGEGKVTITIPKLRHTLKSATHGRAAEVSVVVYRDAADSGGTVFFRVSSPDPSTAGSDNGYLANAFTSGNLTFVDNIADGTASGQLETFERDWGSEAILINASVPGPELVVANADRLFLAGGGIPRGVVLPSKTFEPEIAAGFPQELQLNPVGADVTGLANINGTIVIFTEDQIFGAPGPGQDNTGGGSPYVPERITADVGCISPGSVVEYPVGLLFQTSKGIYGLNQDFALDYVGAPVERYNAQNITAAHTVPDTNQVILLSDDGVTLMYDYLYGQWGTFTHHEGVSACRYGDDYAYMRTDGAVWKRTPSAYTDAGSPVILKVRTGRFRPNGLQGWFKLRTVSILGEYKSPHSLRVRLFYDREQSHTSERVFDVMSVLPEDAFGDGDPFGDEDWFGGDNGVQDYNFLVESKRMKCSQFAIEFSDIISESAGASFELTELLIEFSVERGPNRMPAKRKG